MPECRSCGAPIVWGVTKSGKKMPLDERPEKRAVMVEAYLPDDEETSGSTWYYRAPDSDHVAIVDTFVPHFASCPDASRWKGWRKEDGDAAPG